MIKLLLVALAIYLVWRLLRPRAKVGPPTAMMKDERAARAVLGIGPDADADAIRAAHRRLLTSVHPDRGGSPDLARRVNAARDLLLPR